VAPPFPGIFDELLFDSLVFDTGTPRIVFTSEPLIEGRTTARGKPGYIKPGHLEGRYR
jgi:hypothetical protein